MRTEDQQRRDFGSGRGFGLEMKTRLPVVAALAGTLALLLTGGGDGASGASRGLPEGFFGIAPQTALEAKDAEYMSAGGIERVRIPITWSEVQRRANAPYDWAGIDKTVETAARAGLRVLPAIWGTPRWLGKETTMPVNNARQRAAWTAFLQAAVRRYGPGGEFWTSKAQVGVNYEPALPEAVPFTEWQIWNEANFFYFTYPVSPPKYAKLLTISSRAIKQLQPGAKIVLTGLFGEPTAGGRRGMPAASFLSALYRTPGIKSRFDSVALHPYAVDTESLEETTEALHDVTVENHDRPGLYITEMGWGSQNNFRQVAFEQGIRGQVRELKGAYGFLIRNQRRLNVKQVHWFSWKDAAGSCNFCDSVGLFRGGPKFRPKPAWRAFVGMTGGRLRP
jgi:hypothetical protein